MLRLRPLTLQEVRASWGWIRNGLLAVIDRCRARWMPEDAWGEVMAGRAFVYTIDASGDEIGFALLQQRSDGDGPVLFIWAMWTEPGAGIAQREAIQDELERLASEIKAKRIRMESSRDGWDGIDYWTPVQTIFEHEVA
jgi:hypothetical protein